MRAADAAAAAVPVLAFEGGAALAGGTIWQGATTASIGGTLNIGLNEGKSALLGDTVTGADRLGAFVSGGLGVPGILRFGNMTPVLGDAARGATAEFVGDLSKQAYDWTFNGTNINVGDFGWSALSGAAGGVAGGRIASSVGRVGIDPIPLNSKGQLQIPSITSGRNNWGAIYQGQLTRVNNGYAFEISPSVQVKGGAAIGVGDIPSATFGTVVQGGLDAVKNAASDSQAPITDATSCLKDGNLC